MTNEVAIMKEVYRQPSLPLPVSELHANALRVRQPTRI